jgi:hypothetical protein
MASYCADSLVELERKIAETSKRYARYIEEKERKRKKLQDVHFTTKDQEVLIRSIVIGGIIEHGLRKILGTLI